MKTISEIKFDKIVKEGFHEILKPLGFKKKANNFYLKLESIGQIINIQKSMWGNKNNISFTINTGIFVPEYWQAYYMYSNKEIPDYPTEPECFIRNRIGRLRNQPDTWYEIQESTNEKELIDEMKQNITDFILPYFTQLNCIDKLFQELENSTTVGMSATPLNKLMLYGEFNKLDKAKIEYEKLLNNSPNPQFLETIKEYGQKYGL